LSKWSEPYWGNPKPFTPIQQNGELVMSLDEYQSWRDWSLKSNQQISKMYALLSMEPTNNGAVGISLGEGADRHDFMITKSSVVVNEGGDTWHEIDLISKYGGCCVTRHLIAAEATQQEIKYYLDGKLIQTFKINGYPTYGGLQIAGDYAPVVHIESVWVEFVKK